MIVCATSMAPSMSTAWSHRSGHRSVIERVVDFRLGSFGAVAFSQILQFLSNASTVHMCLHLSSPHATKCDPRASSHATLVRRTTFHIKSRNAPAAAITFARRGYGVFMRATEEAFGWNKEQRPYLECTRVRQHLPWPRLASDGNCPAASWVPVEASAAYHWQRGYVRVSTTTRFDSAPGGTSSIDDRHARRIIRSHSS